MDGHERGDVVKYHKDIFLPMMQDYERWMIHFEGPDLIRTEPDLKPGERRIKAYFHDESCFHANDETNIAW